MENNNLKSICVGCNGFFPENYDEALEGNMCGKCFKLFIKGSKKTPADWGLRRCIKCDRNFQPHNRNKTCNGCLHKEVI